MVNEFRVFGPPGTGKTTYLAGEVGHAAEKYGPDRVLVTSFSRAAAAEIASRRLPVDDSMVGTLHAHCHRALGRPQIAEGHATEFSEAHPYFRLGPLDADLDQPLELDVRVPGDELYLAMQALRGRLVPQERWPPKARVFAESWGTWKRSCGYVDFTDLLELAVSDLASPPGDAVVGFVDEAQDLTPLQLKLVRRWGESMDRITLAGDDDQAIYGWLGATSDAFLSPPVPDSHKVILRQSHRLPRAVHRTAEALIRRLTAREPKLYHPRDADGEVRRLGAATWKHPEVALADAARYLAAGKRVMFLGSCAYHLGPLLRTLRRAVIPYHNPYRRKRWAWNPLDPQGVSVAPARRVLAFLAPEQRNRLWTAAELWEWVEALMASGNLKPGAKAQLKRLEGAAPITREQLAAYFEPPALEAAGKCSLGWYRESLMPSKRRELEFALAVAERHGADALLRSPLITVGTIHSVKGGEADVVYLFPDLSRSGMREWVRGPFARDPLIRMFYVGLTRAREVLVLCGQGGRHAVQLPGTSWAL